MNSTQSISIIIAIAVAAIAVIFLPRYLDERQKSIDASFECELYLTRLRMANMAYELRESLRHEDVQQWLISAEDGRQKAGCTKVVSGALPH
ncbi:hypothetical protein [Loktanella sp. 3ANDIMAR09]|uniref:hypothetical protein n=1 Tax=Loktanella sp. 3ANDIMAR09 TaxID=1225657 RepID=UPI001C119622|nr:hypothetical protein [Loktanella sp. 3ANDIMAR09]